MSSRLRIIVTGILVTILSLGFALTSSAATLTSDVPNKIVVYTSPNMVQVNLQQLLSTIHQFNYKIKCGIKLPQTKLTPQAKPTPQPAPTPAPQPIDPSNVNLTADEQQMLNLVNAERAKNGLAPLKINMNVVKVARVKAQDMISNKYFSHNSPTYGSPFDMMKHFGITYRTAGENLAGAPTVNSAHTNLMNSSGHRANILNGNFKEVGIGIVDGGPYGKVYVQLFIG